MHLRPATPEDAEQIIRLNADSVDLTSPMDQTQFRNLLDLASVTTVAETEHDVIGFIIAMTDTVGYDNANYRWFSEPLRNFLYIDRVVVSANHRAQGIGNALYQDIMSQARKDNVLSLAAEITLRPPNTGSLNFHRKQGFVQIGKRTLDNDKVISMQLRSV